MSRRKPIDAKILEASKAFDAHIFAETIKPTFRRFHSAIFFLGIFCVRLPDGLSISDFY